MDRKEAIEIIRKNWPDSRYSQLREALETIIPELKESENERIRRILIDAFTKKNCSQVDELVDCRLTSGEIIEWLESRGEQATDISSFSKVQQAFMQKYVSLDKITLIKLLAERDLTNAEIVESFEKQGEKQKLDGTFVNVDDVREDFVNEVYRVLDSDPNNDRANQIIDAFDSLPTLESVEQKIKAKQVSDLEKGKWYVCDTPRYSDFIVGKVYYCPKNEMLQPNEGEMARYVAKHCFHPWTIEDAKDGDVLANNGNIILFKNISNSARKDYKYIKSYCLVLTHSFDFYIGGSYNLDDGMYPATKEQCDLLFQKMKEAGYKWDAEKKELKEIEQKSLSAEETKLNSLAFLTELGYTCIPPTKEKSVWSEEDEKRFTQACVFIKNTNLKDVDEVEVHLITWLKSLKDRVQQQPKQEWSEKDEEMLKFWNLYYGHKVGDMPNKDVVENLEKFRDWLKSFKERVQLRQEWSEKDGEMIEETLYFINEYQKSNMCKDENGMQNSVTCENWLKELKLRMNLCL